MRKYVLALALVSSTGALLVSAPAAAEPQGKEQSVKGDKSSGASTPSGPSEQGPAPSLEETKRNADKPAGGPVTEKPWEIAAGWEGHRLIRQSDLEGAAADKYLNYYFASFGWDFSKYDRVSVTGGVYQRFLADPGETGLRADDIAATYRRLVPLPQDFTFSPSFTLIAPTSFISFREGLITAPKVTAKLSKKFGEYVTAAASVSGTYYIQRYNTSRDGTFPNPLARVGGQIGAEVEMPFHRPLSFGILGSTYYGWYYNATSQMPSEPGAGQAGVTPDTTFSSQPITQAYGGEVHARYTFPDVMGFHTDASLAYARDPGSTLHDGVTHLYLFYRLQSEVYASLSAHY